MGDDRRGNVRQNMIGNRETGRRRGIQGRKNKVEKKEQEGKSQDKFSSLCLGDYNR